MFSISYMNKMYRHTTFGYHELIDYSDYHTLYFHKDLNEFQ